MWRQVGAAIAFLAAGIVLLLAALPTDAAVPCGRVRTPDGKIHTICRRTPTPLPPIPPTATPIPIPAPTPTPPPAGLPLVITAPGIYSGSARNPDGTCVVVQASNVIIEAANIGPCSGHGVYAQDVSNLTIRTSFISTGAAGAQCCDSRDGIFAVNVVGLTIHDNTIMRSETNIEALNVRDVLIRGNVLHDPLGPYPRGQQIQIWPRETAGTKPSNIQILDNLMACGSGCNQEDAINLSVHDAFVARNRATGGTSPSGCGLILENDSQRVVVEDNFAEGQQCGFGMAGGSANTFRRNTSRLHSNIGFYAEAYSAGGCSQIVFADNRIGPRPDGSRNDFWYNPARCTAITSSGWVIIN